MNKNLKSDKERICAALDIAYEKVLVEQEGYVARIEAVIALSDDEVGRKLYELGGDGIQEIMRNERCPPCSQDRERHLEQSWNEIPSLLKINKIQDEDIRFKTYFLNEVAEQAERIKATAVFCEGIRPNDDNKQAGFILYLWERQSILTQLAAEQKGLDEDKYTLMYAGAEARKMFIDIFASKYDDKID